MDIASNQRGPAFAAQESVITLGGGCFWCTEAVFERVRGIIQVQSGYCNGTALQPTYEQVCTGRTGHNEVVRLTFDPAVISVQQILQIFFAIHDPTTLNRQGNDVGSQYRSVIFYTSEAQRDMALATIEDVNASGLWPGKAVTEVVPAGDFWPAEREHQDYLERIPEGYTCHFPRAEWVLPKKA